MKFWCITLQAISFIFTKKSPIRILFRKSLIDTAAFFQRKGGKLKFILFGLFFYFWRFECFVFDCDGLVRKKRISLLRLIFLLASDYWVAIHLRCVSPLRIVWFYSWLINGLFSEILEVVGPRTALILLFCLCPWWFYLINGLSEKLVFFLHYWLNINNGSNCGFTKVWTNANTEIKIYRPQLSVLLHQLHRKSTWYRGSPWLVRA